MGKRSHKRRRKSHRVRVTARQIRFLTQGMDAINASAIARKLGLGKDTDAVRRASRSSSESES